MQIQERRAFYHYEASFWSPPDCNHLLNGLERTRRTSISAAGSREGFRRRLRDDEGPDGERERRRWTKSAIWPRRERRRLRSRLRSGSNTRLHVRSISVGIFYSVIHSFIRLLVIIICLLLFLIVHYNFIYLFIYCFTEFYLFILKKQAYINISISNWHIWQRKQNIPSTSYIININKSRWRKWKKKKKMRMKTKKNKNKKNKRRSRRKTKNCASILKQRSPYRQRSSKRLARQSRKCGLMTYENGHEHGARHERHEGGMRGMRNEERRGQWRRRGGEKSEICTRELGIKKK